MEKVSGLPIARWQVVLARLVARLLGWLVGRLLVASWQLVLGGLVGRLLGC